MRSFRCDASCHRRQRLAEKAVMAAGPFRTHETQSPVAKNHGTTDFSKQEKRPMTPSDRIPIRYQVTFYDGPSNDMETRVLTAEELAGLRVEEYDHVLNLVTGEYAYRKPGDERVNRPLDRSGLGKDGLRILQALQLHPGVFLTPREIAELTNNWNHLDPNVLAARVRMIRRAHGENGKDPHFTVSRRCTGYALKWPAELTWIWIERIIESRE